MRAIVRARYRAHALFKSKLNPSLRLGFALEIQPKGLDLMNRSETCFPANIQKMIVFSSVLPFKISRGWVSIRSGYIAL